MSKLKLVFQPNASIGMRPYYLEFLFKQYFEFVIHDETHTYDSNTLFVVNSNEVNSNDDLSCIDRLKTSGHKVIVDNLWESPHREFNCFTISNRNWFWYNESIWYETLGYSSYAPAKTYEKIAFMPINRVREHRDRLVEALDKNLTDFIYSYKTAKLPNDLDSSAPDWQRYFAPQWYDSTYFSIVAETADVGRPFITEKTFKPIAFQHPFMVYASPGHLEYIKSQGFQTFENLFDESYDTMSKDTRINAIVRNVDNFIRSPYDTVTLEKLEHNRNRFYSKELVTTRIINEIINPILEYAETR